MMQLWKVNSNPDKSKLLLKYWMLYSAIKGMCSISANASIESTQIVHYWIFLKSHHQNGWPRSESVTSKNCKLRKALEVEQNYFNVLMNIPVNGRNQIQETQLACRALNTCQKLWEVIFQLPSCIKTLSLHIFFLLFEKHDEVFI